MREQEGESEPAHHARRPMNAFLIFCKRHRSVVRDKYPNLENRSITKILGEWWANLDKEEKGSYTSLAKQYKDAFFSANPDFKWYKLPAPPLRTLASRPRERIPTSPDYEPLIEKTNNNSTRIDLNKAFANEDADKQISMFTPGKLADEAQMGGLSSLLATNNQPKTLNPYYSPPSYKPNQISYTSDQNEATIRDLQTALTETTRVFEDLDEGDSKVYYNDQFTNQDVINQIVDKRYSKDEEYEYNQKGWAEYDVVKGRTCKGKRYQEFMAVGGLIVNKRQKRECEREDYNASCSWEPNGNMEETGNNDDARDNYMHKGKDEVDTNGTKAFKAADFDLDAKIRALPSLSLEKFQQKKRDNKRKKKMITPKLRDEMHIPSQIVNSVPNQAIIDRRDMAEKWRETVIGSQKRKPRKVSITRLPVTIASPSVDLSSAHEITPELKIATEAPHTITERAELGSSDPREDLFALATLAEVAANTSKMEDSAMIPQMASNLSEGNASTV